MGRGALSARRGVPGGVAGLANVADPCWWSLVQGVAGAHGEVCCAAGALVLEINRSAPHSRGASGKQAAGTTDCRGPGEHGAAQPAPQAIARVLAPAGGNRRSACAKGVRASVVRWLGAFAKGGGVAVWRCLCALHVPAGQRGSPGHMRGTCTGTKGAEATHAVALGGAAPRRAVPLLSVSRGDGGCHGARARCGSCWWAPFAPGSSMHRPLARAVLRP